MLEVNESVVWPKGGAQLIAGRHPALGFQQLPQDLQRKLLDPDRRHSRRPQLAAHQIDFELVKSGASLEGTRCSQPSALPPGTKLYFHSSMASLLDRSHFLPLSRGIRDKNGAPLGLYTFCSPSVHCGN